MNLMRMGLFCALVGWMAADAEAQLGTYGSPDPIPLGQYAQRDSYQPAVASRTSYVTEADGSGSNVTAVPSGTIPLPPTESSAIASMMSEPGPTAGPASPCNVLPSGGNVTAAGNSEACGDVCGGGNGCCQRWYASVDALYMTRNQPNKVYTSYEWSNLANQGIFDNVNWTWGEQATVGYRFGCDCDWALQGTYWGLCESNSDGAPNCPGPYGSPMNFGLVNMLGTIGSSGTGTQSAEQYTDNAQNNHVWRNYQAEDLELNLVRTLCGNDCNCCNRFGVDFLVGVRWFRFQDGLVYGAERANDSNQFFTDPYAGDWLYLNDHITNDLVGAQAGFNASYRFANCWKVFITPEFGIYNNHTTLDYNIYSVGHNSGTIYQGSSPSYPNQDFPVHATADGFAFLTQVDLGLDWQISRHVSTQLGYRVVAVTGVGLSDSQMPSYANDTQAIANIQHNDSLILHGAFGGLTFTW